MNSADAARSAACPRFFSAQPLPRPPASEIRFEVNEAIARHIQVLRINVNDGVTLFDGAGGEWHAVVEAIGKRIATVRLDVFNPVERESPLVVTLVQTLATGDKMDLIVQKAVELGIRAIQPIASERANLKLSRERAQKRVAHWHAVAVAACEQCGRNCVPVIAEPIDFRAWVAMPNTPEGVRLLLHPHGQMALVAAFNPAVPAAVAIGPEGGFSDDEIAFATRHGVVGVNFGPRVLRTETAGLAVMAALNGLHGDMR